MNWLLGRHGSDSLCRVERKKQQQDGGYIQCISVQTLIFRLVMNFRHLDLLSGIAPSYSSKEIARSCC